VTGITGVGQSWLRTRNFTRCWCFAPRAQSFYLLRIFFPATPIIGLT